jgi:hypothetical protein
VLKSNRPLMIGAAGAVPMALLVGIALDSRPLQAGSVPVSLNAIHTRRTAVQLHRMRVQGE